MLLSRDLEDSVNRMHDHDETRLDVIDVDASAGAARRPPRPGRAGRSPRRLRQVSLVVAAAIIVVGGFAAGGLLGGTTPSSPPSASPGEVACRPIRIDSPPSTFRLAASGDEVGVRGLPGDSEPRFDEPDPAWQVPWPDLALTASFGGELHLVLATAACVAEVEVEAAPAGAGEAPGPDDRLMLLRTTLDPASPELGFAIPDEGDWVLRIVVRYLDAADPGRLVEMYFRVLVGDATFVPPTDGPAPIVTPAASCGPTPATAADVEVTMTTTDSGAVPGVEAGVEPPAVTVGPGDRIEIAVTSLACATSWTIDARTRDTIETVEGVPNIFNDPGRAAQNRWRFMLPDSEPRVDLVVVLRFGPAVLVERLWRVTISRFEVPTAFVVAPDGRRAPASVGCGLNLQLASGYTASDSCDDIGYDGGGTPFDIAAFEALEVEVPGWTIVGWYGRCGLVTTADGPAVFESSGCELGGFAIEGSETPPPARFVLQPGSQVLELQVTATRDGDRFSVAYYLPVSAR
ncbi:MAG: hypothetical protein AB1736_13980 [Chloroflexota bacterium]